MGKPRSPRLSGVTSLRNPTGDALPSPGLFTPRFYWQKTGKTAEKPPAGTERRRGKAQRLHLNTAGGKGRGKTINKRKKRSGEETLGAAGAPRLLAVTHGSSRFAARRLSALTGSSAAAPPPPSLPA